MQTREELKNEINELKKILWEKEDKYDNYIIDELKEKYGSNFNCANCRYSCSVSLGDMCTYCLLGNCIYCNDYCAEFQPNTKLSDLIEKKWRYEPEYVRALGNLFDTRNILNNDQYQDKAIQIINIITDDK